MIFTRKINCIALSLLLLCFCALPARGWCMTPEEMSTYKLIPITQWQTLTSEWTTQRKELDQLQLQLQKLRKPSEQLLQELQKAKEQLQISQAELNNARTSLTDASNELAASKTSLQTLRQAIDKERRAHRRQIWQNRLWFFLAGAAIGVAAGR